MTDVKTTSIFTGNCIRMSQIDTVSELTQTHRKGFNSMAHIHSLITALFAGKL